MFESVRRVVQSGELPEGRHEAIGSLLEDSGMYTRQEGPYWDFKREWPFSYSDGYFGGIARAVCGFANASGGLLIFGVHDDARTAGHNKVSPNLDRFQKSIDQLFTVPVSLILRRYDEDTSDAVDILLIHPIHVTSLPVRFKKSVGKYAANIIWVRQGNEIVAAEPKHVPLLYCRATKTETEETEDEEIGGLLPPSPSYIRRFVGRLETIDKIFSWLKKSDEPRTFLYGKGGSGKTTIAYQVAKAVQMHGAQLRIAGNERFDNVILVSAKKTFLSTETGQPLSFVGLDFEDERGLYKAILRYGRWTIENLDEMSIDVLKAELKEFFDLAANFVIIDDIDTLTTSGLEAGFDYIYGLLWRSNRRSKVLYTLRNAPSHSISNSIEVPGLPVGGEYEIFIDVCCEQFEVKKPTSEFRDGRLAVVSERRPLVVESIIALAKRSGSYDRALQLFEQNSGDDIREYVFQREWDALPPDNYGRYILAVLSLYGEPLTFADIAVLTRFDDSRVSDAISDIREMFLVLNDVGSETTYTIGALTRSFLAKECKNLDHFSSLKERVRKYKSDIYPENPRLTHMRQRVESLVLYGIRERNADFLRQALRIVNDTSLPVVITEDPRFLSLQGLVCSRQAPPRLDDARRYFSNAMQMGSEPEIEHLRQWFVAERDSGYGVDYCRKIADFVQFGKRYGEAEKIEMLSKKGTLLYNFGREIRYSDPARAVDVWMEALRAHLGCFYADVKSDTVRSGRADEFSRNTCYNLFDFTVQSAGREGLFQSLSEIRGLKNLYLDPLEGPFIRVLTILTQSKGTKADLQKLKGRVETNFRGLDEASRWLDATAASRVSAAIEAARTTLQNMINARSVSSSRN